MKVGREQVIECLRRAGFTYVEETKRTQLWRKRGIVQRVFVPMRDHFDEQDVSAILASAGFTPAAIKRFLSECVKN